VEFPFSLLDQRVQKLLENFSITKPTPIQRRAIPEIIRQKSVLLVSPTGSGKTEAAILPLMSNIVHRKRGEGVKILYVNPLKALTRDLFERIYDYANFLQLKVRPLYGDVNKVFKLPAPEIVIITPESLEVVLDWAPRWWPYFKTVEHVIIDEVHELINSKRGYQLLILIERLKLLTGKPIQRIGLSATLSDSLKAAEFFGGSDGPLEVIEADESRPYDFEVIAALPRNEEEERNPFLAGAKVIAELTYSGPKTLVFTNSRQSAERLQYLLNQNWSLGAVVHHGSVGLGEREKAQDAFKTGLIRCVIATKTLELGIDIGDIEQVIQYKSPGRANVLLQRAGRSQHKPGKKSTCKVISLDPVDFIESLAVIKLAMNGILEPPIVLKNPLDVAAKEILGMALYNSRFSKYWLHRSDRKGLKYITLDDVYQIFRSTVIFKGLEFNKFKLLLDFLESNGLVRIDNGVIHLGAKFWSVWSLDKEREKAVDKLGFSKFFSFIPTREVFDVVEEYGYGKRRKVGELDLHFVYRGLSTGKVIRLGGWSWKVQDIDEKNHVVIVSSTNEQAETPVWTGEGPQRDMQVAREMLNIYANGPYVEGLIIDESARKSIEEYLENIEKSYITSLLEGKVVIERVQELKTDIFITFFGERINRALAAAIFEKIAEKSLLVKYIVSPIGFAIKSEVFDVLENLKEIVEVEFRKLVEEHVRTRSPFSKVILDEIRENFGFPSDETLVEEEAAKQALDLYYDIAGALEVFKLMRNNSVIVFRNSPSKLSEGILRYPYERTWHTNPKVVLEEAINRFRVGSVEELADYVWLSPDDIKEALRGLALEKNLVMYLDVYSSGWTMAKVPLEDGWVTIRFPMASKYAVLGDEEQLQVLIRELERDTQSVERLKGTLVELTFSDPRGKNQDVVYRKSVDDRFDLFLRTLVRTRVEPFFGEKVNVKVHVRGIRLTILHYAVPKRVVCSVVLSTLKAISYALEKSLVSGKRQIFIELP